MAFDPIKNNLYELDGKCIGEWTKPSTRLTKASDKETDEEAKTRCKNQICIRTIANSKCQQI